MYERPLKGCAAQLRLGQLIGMTPVKGEGGLSIHADAQVSCLQHRFVACDKQDSPQSLSSAVFAPEPRRLADELRAFPPTLHLFSLPWLL